MKKFFLFMIALLTGVSGAMALTGTWGSGTFLTATSAGNASYGWFTIVSPFSGTLNSVKLNLGTGSGNSISRTDAYLAISSDLKSSTTGFSASDFVGISTNTCGTTDYEVTMTFNNTQLTGGMTYYCYFLTKSGEIYTTVGQRIYVETGKNPSLMSIGNVGSITAAQTEWAIPISCTMTLSDGLYYRMHALYPDSKCYIYSKSDAENVLWKNSTAPTVTDDRYVWKGTIGASGLILQNVGNSHYISKISGDNDGSSATYLSATSTDAAEQFTLMPNNPGSLNYPGYVALSSTTNADSYLNTYKSAHAKVGSYTAQNNKSGQFLFQQVKKVTFSTAVAVNGGDAVSTIYVAADGSDAGNVTLSGSYKYSFDDGTTYVDPTVAASTITAAGTSDITVTATALTADYTLMYNSQTVGSIPGHSVTFGEAPSVSEFNMAFTTYTAEPATYNDITSGVTVTATWNNSNLQFTTGNPNSISKWYRVRMHSNQTHYMYNNSGAIAFLDDAKPSVTSEDYLWGFKGDPFNGFQVYNKTAGTTVALDNANPCTLSASGKSVAFKFATGNAGNEGSTADTYFALYAESGSYLNYRAVGNIQRWEAADQGSTFMINAVKKVDFVDGSSAALAIAVNGGSTVSTIWVATDGSDSFTLPEAYKYTIGSTTYYAAEAAAAIAAAGASDMTVTVSSAAITDLANLSNEKAYVVTNARGTWQFADNATAMSVASTTYETTDEAQQIAIISRNNNYYLFSVNAGAYLTGSNKLTTMPTDNEQVDVVATGNADYPWFFRFKNLKDANDKYTNNINVSAGIIKIDGWGPDGSNASGEFDEGNCNAIIEAADFDATAALAMFNEISVTYHLQWSDGTDLSSVVADVEVSDARQSGNPAESLPATFENPFVTFSYSPAAIPASGTVTVTASWSTSAPFQLTELAEAPTDALSNAKWYTVGIHTYYESNNRIWKYNSSNEMISTEAVATDAYGSITDNHLFCFVGNPYQGLSIYNKAAGSSKTLYHKTPASYGDQAYMAAEGTKVLPKASNLEAKSVANGYACFLYNSDETNDWYLNCNATATDAYGIYGWYNAGQGSTCWFIEPSEYPYNYLDSFGDALYAPYKAVDTKDVAEESIWVNAGSTKTYLAENPFFYANSIGRDQVNEILDALKAASTITLGNGYWRIVNAYPDFVTSQSKTPAIYYDSSADKLKWGINALEAQPVNDIFKFAAGSADGTYTLYSPNAQKSLKAAAEDGDSKELGLLDATAGDVTIASLGSAQYTIKVSGNTRTIHANNHQNGAGTSGTLVSWNGGLNSCSAWYLLKVDELEFTLNDGGDSYYYATLCLPFDVTITDAHTSAYTLTLNGAKDGLHLSDALTEIPAGTPVFLRGTMNKTKLSLAANAATSAPLTSTALTGVYKNTTVTGGTDYFLGKDATDGVGFYHWDGTSLNANRAYFEASKLSSQVKGLRIDFSTPTTISDLFQNEQADKAIYDLSGRRVKAATRGLYIVNGKKVLVK